MLAASSTSYTSTSPLAMPDAPAVRSTPGLYFVSGDATDGDIAVGGAAPWADGSGQLYGRATHHGHTLYLEGLLFSRGSDADSDAEYALAVWLADGPEGLARLRGYFSALIVDHTARRAFLMGDAFASRPWYLYRRGRMCAAAPTPLFFADLNLPMSLDRQGLYETLRLMHTAAGAGTLIEEIVRIEPGVGYWVEADGRVRREQVRAFVQNEDHGLDLDAAADWLTEIVHDGVRGTLNHPSSADRTIHLSLTAGLDSRHVLGELRAQARPPDRLRHVLITRSEARPVEAMAAGLDLPLDLRPVASLDYDALVHRWIVRSGGLMHAHQIYLLDMAERLPAGGVVGFDGFLMDYLLGYAPHRIGVPDREAIPEALFGQTYTDEVMLRALVPGAQQHAAAALDALHAAAAGIAGDAAFTLTLLQTLNRSWKYSGAAFPLLGDEALYVAPGVHPEAIQFVERVPFRVAGHRRARVHALRRHFPDLAAYPSAKGVPYTQPQPLRKGGTPATAYLRRIARSLGSGGRIDPAPETEHAWLRRIPAWRRMMDCLAADSRLTADGFVRGAALRGCWRLHRLGDYRAWTLMSLLTAEVAYRVLVCRERPDAVHAWLTDA